MSFTEGTDIMLRTLEKALLLGILLPGAGFAADATVLTDLQFPRDAALAGWSADPANVTVNGTTLRIQSLFGAGREWQSSEIGYEPGFALDEATVRVEIAVAAQNLYRDFYLALFPRGGHAYAEPAVMINIDRPDKGTSTVLVRQWEGGAQKTIALADPQLPFIFDANLEVTLELTNGAAKLVIARGEHGKTFDLGQLIAPRWLIQPFTVQVGTMEHGNASAPAVVEISRLRILTTRADEPTAAETIGNGPGTDAKVTCIDLTPYANRRFQDDTPDDRSGGWTDQGANDMRFIPQGYQFFRNVPFYIADKLAVVGNAPEPGCIVLGSQNSPGLQLESKPIQIGATAAYLYFLHASAWSTPNVHCADYVVEYADGGTVVLPLRTGVEIHEWWEPQDLPQAVVAWRGRNPAVKDVGFYLYEWQNPNPDKKIAAVVFRSTNSTVVPILIGITAAPQKIPIGPSPRTYRDLGYTLCEYRDRIKTAPAFGKGPAKLTLARTLPIAKDSEVRQARLDVSRYRASRPAQVRCTVAGLTKTIDLGADRLRAQFLFTEKEVLRFLTEHKASFQVTVETDDADGFGVYRYETNPNHDWIVGGEDVEHGVYAVSGVYMVTPFLPDHSISGYVENRPQAVTPLPLVREQAGLKPATLRPDWLGASLCLNGTWQWQPGERRGFVPTADKIPTRGWQDIVVPADVGAQIFAKDKECISAWFSKELVVPLEWQKQRVVMQFDGVADFATVFCNGTQVIYHEGVAAFEADLTAAVKFGQTNLLQVFAENVYKGIVPVRHSVSISEVEAEIAPYKGYAYRLELVRGAWDQKPDEVELQLDGKEVGKKAADLDAVINTGDGLYHRALEWNTSTLYFSTPGNADLKQLRDRLAIAYCLPGQFAHQGRPDAPHHWRAPRACATGLYRDVSLRVTGRSYVDDVCIRTSVQRMQISAAVEISNIPAAGAIVSAVVRDGSETVLDLGSITMAPTDTKVTFEKSWQNPRLWGPTDPYLYHLQVQLADPAGQALDRRFIRFGFREFRIDGPDFVFNGKKPFFLQTVSPSAWGLPMHRAHLRGFYLDMNQQGNINSTRWHQFGSLYPETAEVADEMGMLLQPEDPYPIPYWVSDGRTWDFDKLKIPIGWAVEACKRLRNNPSVVMWSADNEHAVENRAGEVTAATQPCVEAVLRLNAALKQMDPTRPIVNNGDSALALSDNWKDPRVDTLDGHYVPTRFFADWRQRFGKPCTLGEESLGGPFAWSYQHPCLGLVREGKDVRPYFYNGVNAAARYIGERIQSWQRLELAGITPFSFQLQYNPCLLAWKDVHYGDRTPAVPWPAQSGEGVKPSHYGYAVETSYNFFDPSAPRIYLRTFNAVRDNFEEVPKLEPRLSPEIVIELRDAAGSPLPNQVVWLIPTTQPGAPYGIPTDAKGRAWFWCKSGPGTYIAFASVAGASYQTDVTPAPPGEWLQVKTVRCELATGE
jgi:hypothetical protein